jgi:hypothetical protein
MAKWIPFCLEEEHASASGHSRIMAMVKKKKKKKN